jgi:DNA-binding HxlR family transcriptional regulator
METKAPMTAVNAYNVFRRDCPSRHVFDLVGERWTGLVLLALRGETLRFAALRRLIEGISQKMLTQTLRELERDGLVRRQAFATVPVTVEYSLTALGESLCEVIEALRAWAYANAQEMAAARSAALSASA